MPPFIGNITSTLASTYGISPSWLWAFIGISCVQMFMFVVWRVTGSLRVGWMLSMPVAIFLVFLGFLPVWVVVVYGTLIGSFVMLPVFLGGIAGEQKQETATQTGMENLSWRELDKMSRGEPIKNSKELILRIEKYSQKWAEYHNNLDALLGVTTFTNWPLNIESRGKGLELSKLPFVHSLFIHGGYDWYIADKMIDQDIFKIVGLHKKDASKNLVYLLGKNKETGQPFLAAISSSHLEDDIEKCMDAKEENETNGLMVGLMMSAIGSAIMPALMKGIVDGADTTGRRKR